MMNKGLDIGQQVRFNTNSRQGVSDSNPIHCSGTIQESPDGWVWVKWDNGVSNAYKPYDEDLVLVEENENV